MIYIIENEKNKSLARLILDQNKLSQFTDAARVQYREGYSLINYFQKVEKQLFARLTEKILVSEANFFYCNQPSEQFLFLALDKLLSVYDFDSKASSMFQTSIDEVKTKTVSNSNEFNLKRNPFFIGSLKFPSGKKESIWEDFNYAEWFVPKILLIRDKSEHFLVVNSFYYHGFEKYLALEVERLVGNNNRAVESSSPQIISSNDISLEEWSNEIHLALRQISEGTVQKVVLARYADLNLLTGPNLPELLKGLEDNYKECYTFAYRSGQSIFFGSSPEKLFSLRDGVIETDALAGSFPRGDSVTLDSSLENDLLNDQKNLNEHKSVVEFLIGKLNFISDKINYDKNPVVKKYSNIQHLYTPIKAKVKNDASVISIIENLYPTPAVCGMPSSVASSFIENIETFERGLYSGALGWIGLDNSAEMFVGIRSAILKNNFLRAFAGCGIVKGSNSLTEYNETALKLKPILSLFKNETVNQS